MERIPTMLRRGILQHTKRRLPNNTRSSRGETCAISCNVPSPVGRSTGSFSTAVVECEEDDRRPRLEALRKKLYEEPLDIAQIRNQLQQETQSKSFPSSSLQDQENVFSLLQRLREHHEQQQTSATTPILTDRFQRHHTYLRLSLTERCNLRCQYCMPPEGVPNLTPSPQLLSTVELLQLTSIFVKHGVTKLRLTGGEPLLRTDLVQLIDGLSTAFPTTLSQIGMTTNGVTLKRHMADLTRAGLTHVNISLDTLQPDKFLQLTRRPGLPKVLDSIEEACRILPHGRVKLNCVVMNHVNTDELREFVKLTRLFPIDVRFIEWMPFNDNGWNQDRFVSYQDMLRDIQQPRGGNEDEGLLLRRIQDGPNDTTKWYQLDDSTSTLGRVGFITSMSEHFCGTCNRLRLTANGQIKVCLFGSEEVSLRDVLRSEECSEEDLELLIHYAVQQKHFKLGGHGTAQGIADASDGNRPMTTIGG